MATERVSNEGGQTEQMPPAQDVFPYFFGLGFINLGGRVAQITMMYNKLLERGHWLFQDHFVKIMRFAHMLPGLLCASHPPIHTLVIPTICLGRYDVLHSADRRVHVPDRAARCSHLQVPGRFSASIIRV